MSSLFALRVRWWIGTLVLMCAVTATLTAMPLRGDESPPTDTENAKTFREKTIYIPYEKLRKVFEQPGRGVFLPYDEFRRLWDAANVQPPTPADAAPVPAMVTNVSCEANVSEDVVRVEAKLTVELFTDGWHQIPLRLGDVAITSATVDGQTARLLGGPDEGGYRLLIEKIEKSRSTTDTEINDTTKRPVPLRREVVLNFAKAITKSPGRNVVAFDVTQSPLTQWKIVVPESGVKIDFTPLVAASEEPSEDGKTVLLAFVGPTPQVEIAWTPKAEGATGLEALTSVQMLQQTVINEGILRTSARFDYTISRSSISSLAIRVPADQKVVSVFDPNVRKWTVKSDDNAQLIEIDLFEPATRAQSVTVELERILPKENGAQTIAVPELAAVGVQRQQGVLVVRSGDEISLDITTTRGLLRIDATELPEAVRVASKPTDSVYAIASSSYAMEVVAREIEPRITATTYTTFLLVPGSMRTEMVTVFEIERAGVFELAFDVPKSIPVNTFPFSVHGVELPQLGAASAQVSSHSLAPVADNDKFQKLTVNLSRKAIGRVAVSVIQIVPFQNSELATPGKSIDLPVTLPRLPNGLAERVEGKLIVGADPSLRINLIESQGLQGVSVEQAMQPVWPNPTMNPQLGFIVSDAAGANGTSFTLRAERRASMTTIHQVQTVRIDDGAIRNRVKLYYNVLFSGIKGIRIDVPEAVSGRFKIDGDGSWRESMMVPQPDDVTPGCVAWFLATKSDLIGAGEVTISWEDELTQLDVGKSVTLSIPRIVPRKDQNADRIWGQLILSKSETLDLSEADTTKGLKPIDPQEDIVPRDRIGDAVAAFEYHDDWTLDVIATRYKLEEVKRTSIERGIVRANVIPSRDGLTLAIQGLFRIRSVQQRLPLTLPRGAVVSDVRIGGQSVVLESDAYGDGDNTGNNVAPRYLIPLTNVAPDTPFVLDVRYTLPALSKMPRVAIPSFDNATGTTAIQQVWLAVYIPKNLSIGGFHGNWSPRFSHTGGLHNDYLPDGIASEFLGGARDDFATSDVAYLFSSLRPEADELLSLFLVPDWIGAATFGAIVLFLLVLMPLSWRHRGQAVLAAAIAIIVLSFFLPTLADLLAATSGSVYGVALGLAVWCVVSTGRCFAAWWKRPRTTPPSTPPSTTTTTLIAILCVSLIVQAVFAQDATVVREIFVPESDFGPLVEAARDRVLLKRDEFESLLREAREIRAVETRYNATDGKAPVEAVLRASTLTINVADERAVLDGTIEIDVLARDAVAIPLTFDGVAVVAASLEKKSADDADGRKIFSDDNLRKSAQSADNSTAQSADNSTWQPIVGPAPLGRRDDGTILVVLRGQGTHKINWRGTSPLTLDATRQHIAFRVPRGGVHTTSLTVSGDVEMKSGAAVLSRRVRDGTTFFDLLLPPQPSTDLVMTLNSHRASAYYALVARGVQIAEVTEQYDRLHATITLTEQHQGIREASFAVPRGFELTEVSSTLLDRWQVVGDTLTVFFREGEAGQTTIRLSAIRTHDDATIVNAAWQFPRFVPQNVAADSSVLGLLVDESLDVLDVETKGLFAMETLALIGAIPPSVLEAAPGAPTLRLSHAYYAPEQNSSMALRFRRPAPSYDVEMTQTLTLSDGPAQLVANARLLPKTGKVFVVPIEIPRGWEVVRAIDENGTPLDFRSPLRASVPPCETPQKNVTLHLPRGVIPGEAFAWSLAIAAKNEPTSSADKTINFPIVTATGAARQLGEIFVRDTSEDDTDIVTTSISNLASIDAPDALAFRYASVPFTLSMTLQKRTPRTTAATVSFYRFSPTLLRVRHEITYNVTGAKTRELSFLVPASTPPTPTIRGFSDVEVSETSSSDVERDGVAYRKWDVRLARPLSGPLRLAVDFEVPFSATDEPFTLTPIVADDVVWQSRLVAIEGDEELDITIPTEVAGRATLRGVDVGTIAAAEYRPGKRLLGLFRVASDGELPDLNIARNTIGSLPTAVIDFVSVTARIEERRDNQRAGMIASIDYIVRTGGGAVQVSLPAGAEIWSVKRDNETIKPQQATGTQSGIVIPIPPTATVTQRCVELIVRFASADELVFPELRSVASGETLPILQTSWNIFPPRGEEVVAVGDVRVVREPSTPAVANVFAGGAAALHTIFTSIGSDVGGVARFARKSSDRVAEMCMPSAALSPTSETTLHDRWKSGDMNADGVVYRSGETLEFYDDSGMVAGKRSTASTKSQDEKKKADLSKSGRGTLTMDSAVSHDSSLRGTFELEPARGRRLQSVQGVSVNFTIGNELAARGSVIGGCTATPLRIDVVRRSDIERSAAIAFCATLFVSLSSVSWSWRRRILFVACGVVIGTLLVFVPRIEIFAPAFNAVVYGTLLAVVFYAVNAVREWLRYR
ncbi:MAG: hypothetical protein ACRC46_06005 [Thermoguttaceae bacterium]